MRRLKRSMIGLVASAIFLSGCATRTSSICPPVREHDSTFQDTLADEVMALGDQFPLIVEVLSDYAVTRAQLRACS